MAFKTILIFAALLFFANASFGQSCGGGKSIIHIVDEDGLIEIKDFYIAFHVVSEDQSWRTKDFSKFGWKRQEFDDEVAKKYTGERSRVSFETAFEISYDEYSRLLETREKFIEKNPDNPIVAAEKDSCDNSLQASVEKKQTPFSICTREGCSFMVVAEVQAKDYETAYFVSDFTCGCTKHYELRLKRKRDKCLCK